MASLSGCRDAQKYIDGIIELPYTQLSNFWFIKNNTWMPKYNFRAHPCSHTHTNRIIMHHLKRRAGYLGGFCIHVPMHGHSAHPAVHLPGFSAPVVSPGHTWSSSPGSLRWIWALVVTLPCVFSFFIRSASSSCYNELPLTWELKIIQINFLTILEARHLKWVPLHYTQGLGWTGRNWLGWLLARHSKGEFISLIS